MSDVIVGSISNLLPALPIVAGVRMYSHLPKELRVLFWYCVLALIVGVSEIILAFHRINNHWLGYLFAPISFSLFAYILSAWQPHHVMKTGFLLTIVGYVLFWAVSIYMIEDTRTFSKLVQPVRAVLLVLLSSITMVATTKVENVSPLRHSGFWVSGGILIYFAGMAILLTMSNVLFRIGVETHRTVWVSIQTSTHLVLNIFFTMAILCRRPTLT